LDGTTRPVPIAAIQATVELGRLLVATFTPMPLNGSGIGCVKSSLDL